jgi:ankyrin repeat protein
LTTQRKQHIVPMYELIKKKKREDKLFKDAKKGVVLKKHGRKGKPHERLISLTKELDYITWREVGGKSNPKAQLAMIDFTTIQKGCNTKIFKRAKNLKQEYCLSLIGNERTLDLECSSEDMRDTWYDILLSALQRVHAMKTNPDEVLRKEKEVDKVIQVLNKLTFDIYSDTWRVSKLLTKKESFQDSEFSQLASALENNSVLRVLDLSCIKLTDAGMVNLCTGLKGLKSLTHLSLSGNDLSGPGAVELSKVFKNHGNSFPLRILDLSQNSITDDGIEALASSLVGHKTLEELILNSNLIGDLGCESLIEMIQSSKTLRKLELNDNTLQNDGVIRICKCMKDNMTSLKYISLTRNQVIFPERKVPDTIENTENDHDHSLEINLFLAVDSGDYAEAVLLLLKGADPNIQNEEDGKTPLHIASLKGDMLLLEFLITHPQIDLNAIDDNSTTPVYNAVLNSQFDIAKLLIEKGAEINVPDNHRKTSVHVAAEKGNKTMLKLLVETNKADITASTDEGLTPLHFAASNLHKDVTQYLLEIATKQFQDNSEQKIHYVMQKDIRGQTPLHKAVTANGSKNDIIEVSKELVKNGANVAIEDNQGKTPLHYAPDDIKQVLLNESRLFAPKR